MVLNTAKLPESLIFVGMEFHFPTTLTKIADCAYTRTGERWDSEQKCSFLKYLHTYEIPVNTFRRIIKYKVPTVCNIVPQLEHFQHNFRSETLRLNTTMVCRNVKIA